MSITKPIIPHIRTELNELYHLLFDEPKPLWKRNFKSTDTIVYLKHKQTTDDTTKEISKEEHVCNDGE